MELFREEYLTIQDDYLRVDPSREGSDNDNDVDYSNDELGENSEITPLGDAMEEEDVNDYKIDPDDDDFDDDDDDLDLDLDTEEIEDDERILDFSSEIDPVDDDDLDDDDDDLFDDDDDLDTDITPDLDDDDDDLLSDDDDDDLEDDTTARTSIDTEVDYSSRPHGRVTGTIINHEPGLPGSQT